METENSLFNNFILLIIHIFSSFLTQTLLPNLGLMTLYTPLLKF